MSEIIKDEIKILVRYRLFDEEDEDDVSDEMWLAASVENKFSENPIWHYKLTSYKDSAFNWLPRYRDREKAIDMARKLAQIVKVGKELLEAGYVYDLYMIREVTRRTEISLSDNAMVVIALSALGD